VNKSCVLMHRFLTTIRCNCHSAFAAWCRKLKTAWGCSRGGRTEVLEVFFALNSSCPTTSLSVVVKPWRATEDMAAADKRAAARRRHRWCQRRRRREQSTSACRIARPTRTHNLRCCYFRQLHLLELFINEKIYPHYYYYSLLCYMPVK